MHLVPVDVAESSCQLGACPCGYGYHVNVDLVPMDKAKYLVNVQ